MITVKDLAIELSIKLGDPRQDDGDGTLFWSKDRLRYLSRAYGKLIRTLAMAMRKYKPGFVLPLVPMIWTKDPDPDAGDTIKNPYTFKNPIIDLKEVIVGKEGDQTGIVGKRSVASRLEADNFNQVKYDLDETNKASANNIFYTVINNKLYLLPDDGTYIEINAMGTEDLGVLDKDGEVPIDRTYADMLITFAAIEAMNDLPHPQKVGLYRQELIDQTSVIAAYANIMERREGEVGNG